MIISIPKETTPQETRIAITPTYVTKFIEQGYTIKIEHNAGLLSGFSDKEYQQAGAIICHSPQETYQNSDIILKIWSPLSNELKFLQPSQNVICNCQNIKTLSELQKLSSTNINLFALNLIPRISKAQNMDILSSQDNLSGYEAVIIGAGHSLSSLPLMITSAGTLAPLKVLVIGIGVAGLQAIATAKRLGAIVYAHDIRPETEEQTSSLGAIFIKEISPELLNSIKLVITSAQSEGKTAPIVLNSQQLQYLPPKCVIIDMASDNGGNIPQQNVPEDLIIIRNSHLNRYIPYSASSLFAGNVYNFCNYLFPNKKLTIDIQDEIISRTLICHNNQAYHPYLNGEN